MAAKKTNKAARTTRAASKREADYRHPEAETPLRPEVGTQAQFRKKKAPVTYRYDSSLAPALDWDGQNPAREQAEKAIREIIDLDTSPIDAAANADDAKKAARAAVAKAKSAAEKLRRLGEPFLNWSGKAERLSFDVPTLPLFVHERLSTMAVIETLKSHEKHSTQSDMFDLFGDPRRSIADQVLRAYEYKDKWVNRLILGDALVVMNSLLHYEGLGGQVQMIYVDPPYGVKFGSNFQPFIRKRNVGHNDDDDMTREPEMVKAYRDTWELGLHSYMTYLRDRLLLARDLLHPSGSIFVQISEDNLHHVRELLDEVFGAENKVSTISFIRGGFQTNAIGPATVSDYVLWYCKEIGRTKSHELMIPDGGWAARAGDLWIELPDGKRMRMEGDNAPASAKAFTHRSLESARNTGSTLNKFAIEFQGEKFVPRRGWSTTPEGIERLKDENRIIKIGERLRYVVYLSDFPFSNLTNNWTDTGTGSFTEEKIYVVETPKKVIQRCMLMTTDPGDLIVDPTCGSGNTACVAELWGRRWITIDTSRVPLALARQRMLTTTFPYFELKEEARGPAGGFAYKRRQNRKGEEVGGIVPRITLKSVANNEPPQEEVLVDRPEPIDSIVRVAGPFTVEATIPSPIDLDADSKDDASAAPQEYASYLERMLEVLRKSPVLQVGGGKSVTLRNIRPPTKSLALSAEAVVDVDGNGKKGPSLQSAIDAAHEENTGGFRFSQRPVAIVFGPENGAISEKLVFEAAREAHAKNFTHLYVIGFAIQANARSLIETCEATVGLPATYVQATPDLMMGELLKTTRASQIFSVCGMPDIAVKKLKPEKSGAPARYQAELLGFDVFDPATMDLDHKKGDDVPAWMLDTDYNGLVFHGSQVFFPRTSAWDSIKKALKATHDESVWDHLAGTVSAPFEAGEHAQIAVKVIDDRGNELLVVRDLRATKST